MNTHCWHNNTIKVQVIRNADQSLSPVIPLVPLLFCRTESLDIFKGNVAVYLELSSRHARAHNKTRGEGKGKGKGKGKALA